MNRLFRKLPRVHQLHSRTHKIFDVASDDHQAASNRGCGHQAIHIRQSFMGTQAPPNLRIFKTDLQNPSFENHHDFREKSFVCKCLRRIFGPDLLHPSAYFSHRQNTQIVRLFRMMEEPRAHRRICVSSLAKFANHVGVDEKHRAVDQSSKLNWSLRGGLALRGSCRSKSQSLRSSVSPDIWKANKRPIFASFAFSSSPASASCKIRRCSSSAETPCSAARCFSFFASASETFLTSN